MTKYRWQRKFIIIVQQCLDGQDSGNTSEPFPVSNREIQDSALTFILFSLMVSAMLIDAFRDSDVGFGIRYKIYGKLFNFRRFQAKPGWWQTSSEIFCFADDCALNTGLEADMQCRIYKVSDACTNFGLTIITTKTEVLHSANPRETICWAQHHSQHSKTEHIELIHLSLWHTVLEYHCQWWHKCQDCKSQHIFWHIYVPMPGTEESLVYRWSWRCTGQ